MIIGICGLAGSGKGTIAEYLVSSYNFTSVSFADPLKDGLASMFGWDRNLLEGDTVEGRNWREQPDEKLSVSLSKYITPRSMMTTFGTDIMRKHLHKDIWCILTDIRLKKGKNYVIPDVRFDNEKQVVLSNGGVLWQVRRGPLPTWWQEALAANTTQTALPSSYKVHESEYRWVTPDNTFNTIIYNDGSKQQLQKQIDNLL